MNQPTDEAARASAHERMFDVELLDALASSAAAEQSPKQATKYRRSQPAPLLAAAIALLGLVVTVLIAWQPGGPLSLAQNGSLTQNPTPPSAAMPEQRWVIKPQDLATTPVNSENLAVYTNAIEDYKPLAGFTQLRRLMILGDGVPAPTANSLVPLGKLTKLEELELPLQEDLLPSHLRALEKAKQVHSLRLHCKRAMTQADVQALKLMPALRTLTVFGGELDAATVRSLSELPHLDELNLQSVAGCTEQVLSQLRMLHRLRRLGLSSMGEQRLVTQLGETPTPGAGLTTAVAKALGDLPLLHELKLVSCKVTATALAALPIGLRRICLVRCPDTYPADVLALRHCRNLTEVSFDNHDVTRWLLAIPQDFLLEPAKLGDAQAGLIRDLALTHFDYASKMPNAVRLAIATKPSLTHVKLRWFERDDLNALASVKNLQHLTLDEGRAVELQHLQVLTRCQSLKALTVLHHDWQLAELQRMLPGVEVLTNGR